MSQEVCPAFYLYCFLILAIIFQGLSTTFLLLFSSQVMSSSLRPHKLQHTRLLYPSLSPWVWSNLCPLSQWCHPTLSSSVTPLSSCPQSFPESGSFRMSWLLASGGQSIGASTSASVLLMNIQGWFPLGLTSLIPLQLKGLSRDSSSITAQKCQLLDLLYGPTLTYDYWKNHNFDYTDHIL